MSEYQLRERMGLVPMFAREELVNSLDELLVRATESGSIMIHVAVNIGLSVKGRYWNGQVKMSAYPRNYDRQFIFRDTVSPPFEARLPIEIINYCSPYISKLRKDIEKKAPHLEIKTDYFGM